MKPQSQHDHTETPIWIYLCPVEWRNNSALLSLHDMQNFVVLKFEKEHSQIHLGHNTALIKINDDIVECSHTKNLNTQKVMGNFPLNQILDDIGLKLDFKQHIGSETGNLVPLFLVAFTSEHASYYISTSFHNSTILFLNCDPSNISHATESIPKANLLLKAISCLEKYRLMLINHNTQNTTLKKYLADEELEYKLNLPSTSNIWELAHRFYLSIAANELSNFILHFSIQFTQWELDNHVYQVIEPESMQGYISFMPGFDKSDLRYFVKHKIYRTKLNF